MAPWWMLGGTTLLLLVLVSFEPVLTQFLCGGNGIPGIPGSHGASGRDGPKGEKGEPGDASRYNAGLKGDPGVHGPPGRPGMKGDLGETGPAGFRGKKGEKGRPFSPFTYRELFSLKRVLSQLPENDLPMDFNSPIIPELDPRFQGDTLTNGSFVCKTSGVYFFSFHISVKNSVCLKLVKRDEVHMEMCDYWNGFLVTSGSALLPLEAGDTVSLQTTRNNNIYSQRSHTFTGFLIFKK